MASWLSRVENGWFPALHANGYLVCGRGTASIVNAETGTAVYTFIEGEPCPALGDGQPHKYYKAGWWSDSEAAVVVTAADGNGPYALVTYNVQTGAVAKLMDLPNLGPSQVAKVSNGHWMVAQGKTVIVDGVTLGTDLSWNSAIDGIDVVSFAKAADGRTDILRWFRAGKWVADFPLVNQAAASVDGVSLRAGRVGYGLGHPRVLSLATSYDTDEYRNWDEPESTPAVAGEWIWTVRERPKATLVGRPIGSDQCVVVDVMASAVFVTAVERDNDFLVACSGDCGQLTGYVVPKATARAPIPKPAYLNPPLVKLTATPQAGSQDVTLKTERLEGSGEIRDYRYYVDGVRCAKQENTDTHVEAVAPGLHSAFVLVASRSGERMTTDPTPFTVEAVVPPEVENPPEPIEPVPNPPEPPQPPSYADPAFHRGIQVDATIGGDWLDDLVAHGATLVRVDCLPTAADVPGVVARLERQPALRPLYLASPQTMRTLPLGCWVELWNNSGGANVIDPKTYAGLVREALPIARERGQRLWVGCLDNMNDDWLVRWLPPMITALGPAPWSEVDGVTVHWYPDDAAQTFARGHNGRTKQQDVAKFRALIGARPWLVTECGYHNALVRKRNFLGKWTDSYQLSEADALQRLRQEDAFWRTQAGCAGWVIYQLTDGPRDGKDYNTPICRYGLRAQEGPWKQQGKVWL